MISFFPTGRRLVFDLVIKTDKILKGGYLYLLV